MNVWIFIYVVCAVFFKNKFYDRYHLHFRLFPIWQCMKKFGSETLAWTWVCGSLLDPIPVLEVSQEQQKKSPPLPLYVKIQRVSFHCHLYCIILLSSVVTCLVCQVKLMWHHKYNLFFLCYCQNGRYGMSSCDNVVTEIEVDGVWFGRRGEGWCG